MDASAYTGRQKPYLISSDSQPVIAGSVSAWGDAVTTEANEVAR